MAAAKEAAKLGAKVVCFDFVVPSPQGTKWGLGGTCVNVGCIPKKIMHYSATLGRTLNDAKYLGWNLNGEETKDEGETEEHGNNNNKHKGPTHNWNKLVTASSDFIRSLNFSYRVSLQSAKVTYINAFARFIDPHTLEYTDSKQNKKTLTTNNVLLAVGGRPKYPDAPGAKEYGITSDDIFWLQKKAPGKTLVVGGSYIALECAGFLHELGFDTTVLVRSILLRGFDQQCANMIGELMECEGLRFIRPATVVKIEKKEKKT